MPYREWVQGSRRGTTIMHTVVSGGAVMMAAAAGLDDARRFSAAFSLRSVPAVGTDGSGITTTCTSATNAFVRANQCFRVCGECVGGRLVVSGTWNVVAPNVSKIDADSEYAGEFPPSYFRNRLPRTPRSSPRRFRLPQQAPPGTYRHAALKMSSSAAPRCPPSCRTKTREKKQMAQTGEKFAG